MSASSASTPENETLIIWGSPHPDGHTAVLLRAHLEERGITSYALYDCFKQAPSPCDGCGDCKMKSGCSKPDLSDFYRGFEACSLLIFAFPVYNGSFPAPLKALIDRLQVYYEARFSRGVRPPIQKKKKVQILMTAGGDIDASDLILAQLRPVFTVTNCSLDMIRCQTGTDKGRAQSGPPYTQRGE